MEKIFFVSSLQPESNYSRYLCESLHKNGVDLVAYAEKDERNSHILSCGEIKQVWSKNIFSTFQIFWQILKDRPKKIHFQHEINMFGGVISALLFPLLVFLTRIFGVEITTTIHGVVPAKKLDSSFAGFFSQSKIFSNIFLLKVVFKYIYKTTCVFSNKIIVHTNLLKKSLHENYGVREKKVFVIPHGVPSIKKSKKQERNKEKYFFYFGYIVKRKGLDKVIKGFIKFLKKTKRQDFKLILGGGIIKGQEFAFEEIKKIVDDSVYSDLIKFTGFLSEEQISHYFKNSYAVVMPAAISISASGPLAQNFAYGKCALVSSIGNFVEEIDDKKTGLLVKEGRWNEMFEFAVQNPTLVLEIEKSAYQQGLERSWDKVSTLHMEVYGK